MNGYSGKLLRVDLSSGEIRSEPLDEGLMRLYLGGRGLAALVLYNELEPGIDPCGSKNKLVIATGVLTGTPAAVGNRTLIASKSPLTGVWGDSVFGGNFGGELKKAGFDALVINGVSQNPVYLWIENGKTEIRNAEHLWGMETGPVQDEICRDVGKAVILSIGPAGENLVGFASVISELRFCAGRTGMGAVLGSKRLKAIAVRGTADIDIADRKGLISLTQEINRELKNNASIATLTKYGTWNNLTPLQQQGILPTKNFQAGVLDGGHRIESESMVQAILSDRETCPNCPIFCRRVVQMKAPYEISGIYGGPQYETVAALGSLLLNTDPSSIAKAHELCNRYGIDTMSAGAAIAWAMECWERGIDLGRPLPWGDKEVIFSLIEEIAYRKGVGALLADGVASAASKLGKGSEDWALHVKGLEIAMHDPRGKKGMGLAYATANRGGCHLQSIHEDALEAGGPWPELGLGQAMGRKQLEGKAYLIKTMQDYFGSLADSLGLCKFPMNAWRPLTPERILKSVALVTGWNINLEELLMAGERIYNICRLFNVREGINRIHDTLPHRLTEPLPEGASSGERVRPEDLDTLLNEYYVLRDWDDNGMPSRDLLVRLDLANSALHIP